jgi:hypothetical protein
MSPAAFEVRENPAGIGFIALPDVHLAGCAEERAASRHQLNRTNL